MKKIFKDPASAVVILLTVGLFLWALFLKGFTHDLLLEAGVFLVSAKLILMAAKNAETEDRIERLLLEIKSLQQASLNVSAGEASGSRP